MPGQPPPRDGAELRPITISALEAIRAGRPAKLEGLVAAEGALPPPHVAERTLRLLAEGCPPEWALPYNIIDAENERIVGGCGFKGAPIDGVVEIGYGVAAACQRQGYASHGVRSLVARAVESGAVSVVTACIAPGNLASETVAARAGFLPGTLIADESGEQVVRWELPISCSANDKHADDYVFDPDRLVDVLVDRDNQYSVMRDDEAGVAVLEVPIPWIFQYCVYYWLSADDLRLLEQDKPAFDRLVRDFAVDKGERFFSHRLLLNQGPGGDRYPQSAPQRVYDAPASRP
jgi:RimJ/RimL family protein N-acetyltransferase